MRAPLHPALLELLVLSVKGRIRRTLRLLRQPKYLIGFVAGLAYFVLIALPWIGGDAEAGLPAALAALGDAEAGPWVAGLGLAAALMVALVVTGVWLFTPARPSLALSEGELHTLLAAPVARRELIAFALLKSQLPVLLTVVILTALSGGGTGGPVRLPAVAVGYWIVFTLADLHIRGVGLTKMRLAELGPAVGRVVRPGVVVLLVAFWATVIWVLRDVVAAFVTAGVPDDAAAFGELLGVELASPGGRLLGALTAPFRIPVAPFLPGTGPAAWLLALALLGLHVLWLVTSRVRFEEAALAQARNIQRRLAAGGRTVSERFSSTAARRRQPFALPAAGRPTGAVVWKNLMGLTRRPLLHLVGLGGGFLALIATLLLALPLSENGAVGAVMLTLILGCCAVAVLPPASGLLLRQDLRADLLHVEALKTWPLTGRQLVAAQVVTPVLLAGLLSLLGAGVALIAVTAGVARGLDLFTPEAIGLTALALAGALVAGLGISAYSVTLQNLAALAFPSLVPLGPRQTRSSGPANTGRFVLVSIAHLVGLAVGSLLPLGAAALIGAGGAALLGLGGAFGPDAGNVAPVLALLAIPAGLAAGLVYCAETAGLLVLAGRMWDRLDPSREMLGEE